MSATLQGLEECPIYTINTAQESGLSLSLSLSCVLRHIVRGSRYASETMPHYLSPWTHPEFTSSPLSVVTFQVAVCGAETQL